jgi:valyl-tRNA synthetase
VLRNDDDGRPRRAPADSTVRATDSTGLSKGYDHRSVEGTWYPIWERAGYFRASDESSRPAFSIVIPPPNITGSLHIGHALGYTLEDLVTRYKRMKGFNALWLPGTDHAGIATQLVVERELAKEGITRQELGREKFVARVWDWKRRTGARITEQLRVLGCGPDWDRERFTLDEGLSRAVRRAFVELHREGLIYRAHRLINWCPRCLTALSDLEVEHEGRAGSLWLIAYPVVGSDQKLTVATTRPETLLGDTAVAVHPGDDRFLRLIGRKVRVPLVDREVPIIGDAQLVDPTFGTGVVKVTPAHDFNDFETGKRHGLPSIALFDEHARTTSAAGAYAGLDRMEARKRVLSDLEARGLLVSRQDHLLSVATCQRCATVVEPMLSWQWFVRMEPLAAPAIEAVESGRVRFIPESWTSTYFHWMRNIHDWCISRQLWWGHQIPAWHCDCGKITVAEEDPAACEGCGGSTLRRDPDVLDTWFSAGLWPFSTLGWPDSTKALETFYPTTLMETAPDILFFWVARMIMMGLRFTDDVPFRDVFLHALVRDEHGEKMSKTKGNVIDPLEISAEYGADALRFTLAALSGQGRDVRLSLERVAGNRSFANKVWNASRFALMNLEDFPAGALDETGAEGLAERWIRSRLDRTAAAVNEALEAYRFSDAASAVYQFIWHELCDWYIEFAKVPLNGGEPAARRSAQRALVDSLDGALRLLHPFMPFLTEEIWQRLPHRRGAPPSVMLAAYPQAGEADAAAEREMGLTLRAISSIRTLRGESNLPPGKRIPVRIRARSPEDRRALLDAAGLIRALAQVSELAVEETGPRLRRAAVAVEPDMEIAIPLAGLIDFAEEERRLRKEIARSEEEQATLLRKLANPSFLERAPEAVVAKDRSRSGELEGKIERLRQSLQVITETEEEEDTMHIEQKNPYGSPFGTPSDSHEETSSSGLSPGQERPWERAAPIPTYQRAEERPLPAPPVERRPPKRAPAKAKAKSKARSKPKRKVAKRKTAKRKTAKRKTAKRAARSSRAKARSKARPKRKAKSASRRKSASKKGRRRVARSRKASRRRR